MRSVAVFQIQRHHRAGAQRRDPVIQLLLTLVVL